MSAWKDGYFAEEGYTFGYYTETMPTRLYFAGLLYGVVTKRTGFRYLDMGCGQGLNLILAAAMHPDSEFVGIDFMPEHIAHARNLAEAAGLTNIRFIEADFRDVAADPAQLGGTFDYAVAHGITSWISPQVRTGLYAVVGQCLKPGGIFYNSYNTLPGWLAMMPFQHMVLQEQLRKDGKSALAAARSLFTQLNESQSALFAALPTLAPRLEKLSGQDPAYLVQEYNNQYWDPQWVTTVIDTLGTHKLSYLGTATLSEAFDQNYPEKMRAIMAQQAGVASKEQVRDLLINQTFRRDLYVKGLARSWPLTLREELGNIQVMANPFKALPEADAPFVFGTGTIEVKGVYAPYHKLMTAILGYKSPPTIAQLTKDQESKIPDMALMVSLLIHGGWLFVFNPDRSKAKPAVEKLNIILAQAVQSGAPYRFLASAATGNALSVTEVDMLQIAITKAGGKVNRRVQDLSNALSALGRSILRDGQPLTDKDAVDEILTNQLKTFESSCPKWEQLGVIHLQGTGG